MKMEGLKVEKATNDIRPAPYATEGRAAYMIRMCIEHHNRQNKIVEEIRLGRFLWQNLLDNISIAYEAKGEDVDYDEVEYNGTLIRMSMALNSYSGFEWTLSTLAVN